VRPFARVAFCPPATRRSTVPPPRHSGARNQIGDAQAFAQQQMLLPGIYQPMSESGGVQCRPEAISRPGEVVPSGAGVEAGIDAAEQDFEIWTDQVWNRTAYSSRHLSPGGPGVTCGGTIDHVQRRVSRIVRIAAEIHDLR
jgi:hypothetical protein